MLIAVKKLLHPQQHITSPPSANEQRGALKQNNVWWVGGWVGGSSEIFATTQSSHLRIGECDGWAVRRGYTMLSHVNKPDSPLPAWFAGSFPLKPLRRLTRLILVLIACKCPMLYKLSSRRGQLLHDPRMMKCLGMGRGESDEVFLAEVIISRSFSA